MIRRGLSVRVAESIHQVDQAAWDSLAQDQVVMSHRWQRVMEDTRSAYRPRYVLAEDADGPLLGIVANTREAFGRTGWREAALRRLSVVVSAPFSSQHSGWIARRGTTVSDILPLLERGLGQLCWREQRLVAGVANVGPSDVDHWRTAGFITRRQPVSMKLDLPTSSYEQYLTGLNSRDLKELRRARRRAAELNVTFTHAPLRAADRHLFPMFAEVCARHAGPAADTPFSPALFSCLERELPGEVMVFSGAVDGQPAGYFLCLVQGQTLLATLTGLRYELAQPSSMYFLLLDEMIRWSLRHGIASIHAGLTNEQQKRRHGFRPRARWFCFRAYPGALHRAVSGFHVQKDR
jgi:predicted N-acyltransferase